MKRISKFLVLMLILFVSLSAQNKNEIIVNSDLKLIQLSENIFLHISNLTFESGAKYPCNGVIYFNNNDCIIVDTPPSDSLTKNLIDWIKENRKEKIVGIVATHWHNDCAGGLQAFHNENIKSYSLDLTRDTLIVEKLPFPQNVFSDSLKISAGNNFAELYYFGGGHVKDNIVVWFEDEKILFGGCLVKSAEAKTLGYLNDADLNNWDKTLLKVKKRFSDAEIIIPGHGKVSGMEAVDNSIKLIKEYREKTK